MESPIQEIPRRCVILGFGGVAKPVSHILATKYPMKEYVLVDQRRITDKEIEVFGKNTKVSRLEISIAPSELFETMMYILKDNDVVLDFYGCNESLDILFACHNKKGIVYLNASLEENILEPYRFQSSLYAAMNAFSKKFKPKFTGCIDAGANPGMITHFCILGIYSMAKSAIKKKVPDAEIIKKYLEKKDIAALAEQLKVDVIHISEWEKMEPNNQKLFEGKTTNSWCIPSFHNEWFIHAEVSIGTHDKKDLSQEGYINIPGAFPPSCVVPFPLYMKTACPEEIFTGKLVCHPETLEISQIFSTKNHVPTCAFVYHPSRLTRQSVENEGWQNLPHLVFDEENSGPITGSETMGATLISSRKDIPPRWFGSRITCEQEREIGAKSNPTTLQVAAGVISHLLMALEEPERGLCMPHEFDSEKIMEFAKPYLGTIYDVELPFRLPTAWSELLSDKEAMDYDLV